MNVIHGRSAKLLLQIEDTFRTAPGTPAAFRMPFSTSDFGRAPDRQEDPTLNGEALAQKQDETDSMVDGSFTCRFDLNAIGWWLYLLWGPPTTSGAGPYEHVWTLNLDQRPTALLEIAYGDVRFNRFLGVVCNSMSWDVVAAAQNMTVNLLGAQEVLPRPNSIFDDGYSEFEKARACAKGGHVFETGGSGDPLGEIAGATVNITNDFEPQMLADNKEGPGCYLLGQPAITGELRALFANDRAADKARAHDTVPLTLASRNADDSASLTLTLPETELSEPKQTIESSRGITHTMNWRAFTTPGESAPTITLSNSVASYAT